MLKQIAACPLSVLDLNVPVNIVFVVVKNRRLYSNNSVIECVGPK
jgi:hypothetical protein